MKTLSKSKAQKTAVLIFKYLILTGLAFIILYPMFMKLSLSFMSLEDTRDATVRFIPKNLTLQNFALVIKNINYFPNLMKTMAYVIVIGIIQVAFATFASYGFACFKFPGRNILFGFVLATLIIPPQIITLPLFINFRSFDILGLFKLFTGDTISLVGSPIPLYIMTVTGMGLNNGLLIFILRQYFKNFPRELEESASIDGAGVYKTFFTIVLPSAIPMILTCFLFAVVWQWTDIYYTSIFIPDNTFLATELESFKNSLGNLAQGIAAESNYSISLQTNAGILLFVAPLLLVFFVCQRHFIESIERTGLVG